MRKLFSRNTPQLETERLRLRKLVLGDVEDIFAYASDARTGID